MQRQNKPPTLERLNKRLNIVELVVASLVTKNKKLKLKVANLEAELNEFREVLSQDEDLLCPSMHQQQQPMLDAAVALTQMEGNVAVSSAQWSGNMFANQGECNDNMNDRDWNNFIGLKDNVYAGMDRPGIPAAAVSSASLKKSVTFVPVDLTLDSECTGSSAAVAGSSRAMIQYHTPPRGGGTSSNNNNNYTTLGRHRPRNSGNVTMAGDQQVEEGRSFSLDFDFTSDPDVSPIFVPASDMFQAPKDIDVPVSSILTPSISIIRQQQMLLDFYQGSAAGGHETGQLETANGNNMSLTVASEPAIVQSGLWTQITDGFVPEGNISGSSGINGNTTTTSAVQVKPNDKIKNVVELAHMKHSSIYPTCYNPAPVASTNVTELLRDGQLSIAPSLLSSTSVCMLQQQQLSMGDSQPTRLPFSTGRVQATFPGQASRKRFTASADGGAADGAAAGGGYAAADANVATINTNIVQESVVPIASAETFGSPGFNYSSPPSSSPESLQ